MPFGSEHLSGLFNQEPTKSYLRIYESTKWMSDINDTFNNIVDTVYDVLDAEEVYIYLLEPESNVLSKRASRAPYEASIYEALPSWSIGRGRSEALFDDGLPQILDFAHPHVDDVLPPDDRRYGITFPIITEGSAFGICVVTYYERKQWSQEDIDRFSMIGYILGTGIQRLNITEKVSELAVLNDRKRLSSEIHDNVVQFLHAVSLNAAAALVSYEEGDEESLVRNLEKMEATTKETIKVFRDEMLSLRSPLECERTTGLVDSIEKTLNSFKTNWGIETDLIINSSSDPIYASTAASLQLMRILNECLSNILRHSGATFVTVVIAEDGKQLSMEVKDNGRGFDIKNIGPDHYGIKIMQERANSVRGHFDIKSYHYNGTTVKVVIPRHIWS